jgi:hypothetical protein
MWRFLVIVLVAAAAAQLSGQYCLYGLSSPLRHPDPALSGRLGSGKAATGMVSVYLPAPTRITGILINASGNYTYSFGLGEHAPPPESLRKTHSPLVALVSGSGSASTAHLASYARVFQMGHSDSHPVQYMSITPAPGCSFTFDFLTPCLYSDSFLLSPGLDPPPTHIKGPPVNTSGYISVSVDTWPPLRTISATDAASMLHWSVAVPPGEARIQFVFVSGIKDSCGNKTGHYASSTGSCEACDKGATYQPLAGQTACLPVTTCVDAILAHPTLSSDSVCFSNPAMGNRRSLLSTNSSSTGDGTPLSIDSYNSVVSGASASAPHAPLLAAIFIAAALLVL